MSSGEDHVIQVIIHEHLLFRVVDQIRGYDSLRARGGGVMWIKFRDCQKEGIIVDAVEAGR